MCHVNGDVAVKYVIERQSIGTHKMALFSARQDDGRAAVGPTYRQNCRPKSRETRGTRQWSL
jgi:hypothetical protein